MSSVLEGRLCLERYMHTGTTIGVMKNPHAVALGRLGGLKGGRKGGRARAAALSGPRRVQIARAAAAARWGRLPQELAVLFPGYRLDDLSLPRDRNLVMLHVLSQGGRQHKRWLVRRFGGEGVRRWIFDRKGRGLTVAQMLPWVPESTARLWQADDPYALVWENR
jgi:hypothetical protein